ncbi:MAG TPA: adenylyltransferase, partial [Gemmatimonadota bacterium]|nr:adenylyltransferase [Gemmatimonadota bacterium]
MTVTRTAGLLIEPCGGHLVDLLEPAEGQAELKRLAGELPSIQVSERVVCDLELLATGAFSPLDRFMGSQDLDSVLDEMRLASGQLFPIPVTLPIGDDAPVAEGRQLALRNAKNELLAVVD